MEPVIEPMGESALLLRLDTCLDVDVNARVHVACRTLREAALPAVQEMVPAYASVLIRLAPAVLESTGMDLDQVADQVRGVLAGADRASDERKAVLHRIPVCYGGVHGPDLEHVAGLTGLTRERLVELHAGTEYRVAMIGFAPGFAYLLGMDERLQVPRREQPRIRVPRGSVAIGGVQTGIYPSELPGGWQLIGRTPARLFDAGAEKTPCRLAPGDRVRFEPIDHAAFQQWEESASS